MMSWPTFLGFIGGLYGLTNLLFAIAYSLGGNCIANARPGALLDAFFFSIQTIATIGYGSMYPVTLYAHILVTLESMVGLLGIAMATGLMFARFSRPTARVLFSRVAVVAPHNNVPTLMFRTANRRSNQILEARLWVTLIRDEQFDFGQSLRRIYDLHLIRHQTPSLQLTWTAMHPITTDSPLYGETVESLIASNAEIRITLTGTDETVAQTVHARHAFSLQDIHWNHHFADIISKQPNGQWVIDYTRFHDVVPLTPSEVGTLSE